MRRFLSAVPLIAALIVPGVARAQATREITGKVTQVGTNAPLAAQRGQRGYLLWLQEGWQSGLSHRS